MYIRSAKPDDLPEIVRIYNASISTRMATADTHPVTVEKRRNWFESHHAKRPLLVACIDETIAGFVSLRDYYDRPAYYITAEIAVYVHAQFQRQGIARSLVQCVQKQAKAIEVENIIARVYSHNKPSLHLFTALGFVQWGLLPNVTALDGERQSVTILGWKSRVGSNTEI